jgi:hypothetical protein
MKHTLVVAGVIALGLPLFACSGNDTVTDVAGTGDIVTETPSVSDFNAVLLTGPGFMVIEHTGEETLTITGEENIVKAVTTDVVVGELRIELPPAFVPTTPVIYQLTVNELVQISGVGISAIVVDGIRADTLTILANGSRISAEGVVDVQDIRVLGGGNYRAPGVVSRTAVAEVSDIGLAWIQVSDTLWATVRDAGTVEYSGFDPVVIADVSDNGKVVKR